MVTRTSATQTAAASAVRLVATTCVQDGVWLLTRLHGQSPAFHLCRAYRVTGQIQVGALRTAWRRVLDRHEALRTTLLDVDGRPVQAIAAGRDDSFVLIDLSDDPPPEADLHQLCAGWAVEPLDLANGPLARLIAVQLETLEHVVLIVVHQAICDDSSMSVLAEELSTFYSLAAGQRGAVAGPGNVAPSPELTAQYADYARWQRSRESNGDFWQLQNWWAAELAPSLPSMSLPTDRAPTAEPSFAWETLAFNWGGSLGRSVSTLAHAEATTPLAILLTGFQAVLSRSTGEHRVTIGVPATVRPRPEFGAVVGAFGNLLPLCGDLSASPSFREAVRRAGGAVQRAFAHAEVPFQHLVRVLNPERDPLRPALCVAGLVVREAGWAVLRLAGALVRPWHVHSGAIPGDDLTLTVDQLEPTFAGALGYNADRIDRSSAAGLLEQFHTFLTAALAAPDLLVDNLPLETAERTLAVVREADRIGDATATDRPVHQLVSMTATRHPDAAAVEWSDGVLPYQKLESRARAIAARLQALGGVEGAAVAVRMSPGPWQVATSLAVLHSGAHLTWFSPGDAGERGRAILADLRPACLVLDGDPNVDALATWYRDEVGGRVVNLAMLTLSELAADDQRPGGLDQVAYVAYTAGSTGKPKGVAQSHGAFGQFITWMATEFGLGPGSRVAQWAALEHDPSLCEVFATLVAGGTLCPVPPRIRAHPEKLVDWLARERVTMLQTIPSFARELLAVIDERASAEPLAALSHLVLMGETLPGELADAWRAAVPWVRLANIYGPTETIAATWCEVTEPVTGRTAPIGRPLPGRQVLVLDDRDRPCPTGVVGEIVIRSPYTVAGYLGEPAGGPAFRPVRDLAGVQAKAARWYRTGDLGRRRWDGLLEFRGRRDFQVKLAGTRVELAEVEAVLADHESVVDCAVTAVSDQDGLVTRLVAYVVPRRSPSGAPVATVEKWRSHLRRRFGRSMVRVSFATVHHIPRNLAGKVDRKQLPDPGRVVNAAARPRSWLEEGMAEIWADLVSTDPADVDEIFFAVGGHSMLVPRLVAMVRERFGVDVSIAECFANPTLSGMSAVVAAAGARRYESRTR